MYKRGRGKPPDLSTARCDGAGGAAEDRGARGGGMVGGGLDAEHHTHPPSADLRRGRSTHTLPPFCPCYHHTIPPKNLKPRRAERAPADSLQSYKVHYAISTELLTKGGASDRTD